MIAVLRRAAGATILAAAFTKASVLLEALPYWDLNPLTIFSPTLAVGPAGAALLDAVIILAAGVALAAESLDKRPVRTWMAVAFLVGVAGVLLHALILDPGVESMRIGASWIAAMAGALAFAHLGRDEDIARIAAALLAGFVAMLAAKGVVQVLIEHPLTVDDYEANKEAFLAARGWSPDSVMARTFERRLYQPEASGWFGLSNVYASLAAGATVMLAGVCVPAWRAARAGTGRIADGFAGLVTLGLIAGVAALYLSHSRGGLGAFLIGASLLLIALAARRVAAIRNAAPILGVALLIAVFGAVALRGMLGERLGELSILFRWFYLQGAAGAWAADPLTGVGPAGFKDAYLLHKPALSPEEVASPHNVIAAYVAMLGLFGLAWVALLVAYAQRAGRVLLAPAPTPELPPTISPTRLEVWTIIAVAAAASIISVSIEAVGATPESMASRLAGLGAWCGVAIGFVVVARAWPAWRTAIAAAALAMAAHALIEVSATWPGSAALVLITVGLGAGATTERTRTQRPWHGAAVVLIGFVILITGALPALRFEQALFNAAQQAGVVAEFRQRLLSLDAAGRAPNGDSISAIARDLSAVLRQPVGPAQVGDALSQVTRLQIDRASTELGAAIAIDDRHAQLLRIQSRLQLEAAAAATTTAERDDRLDHARALAAAGVARRPSASSWHWVATVLETIADQQADPDARSLAAEAWAEVHTLDPHNLTTVEKLYDASRRLGDDDAARRWAAEALRIDESMRLDPLRRLTDERRAELQRALGSD